MLHIAMFDAINSIEDMYTPYLGQVKASHGASAEVAAATAARDSLAAVYTAPADVQGGEFPQGDVVPAREPRRMLQSVDVDCRAGEQACTNRGNDQAHMIIASLCSGNCLPPTAALSWAAICAES